MLAHKVDEKHPTSYSELLLAAQKLEKWAEAERYPALKDHHDYRIKCYLATDIREFVSL